MAEIRRRKFLTLLGGAAAAARRHRTALAQAASKRPRISWISGGTRQLADSFIEIFLRGMTELGYVEGRNFDIVYRFTEGYQERLSTLTEELVRLKPDVIL